MQMGQMTQEEKTEYVNVEAGIGRVRGNVRLYKMMLGSLAQVKEFDLFEQALQAGDLQQAADVAHAIKGLTGNLSLDKVFHLSTELVEQLRKGIRDEELLAQYRQAVEITHQCAVEAMGRL